MKRIILSYILVITILSLNSCNKIGLSDIHLKTTTTVVMIQPHFELTITNKTQDTFIEQSNDKYGTQSFVKGKTIIANPGDQLEIEIRDLITNPIKDFAKEVSIELFSEHYSFDKSPYVIKYEVPNIQAGTYTVVSSFCYLSEDELGSDSDSNTNTFEFNIPTIILAYIQIK